MSLRARAVFIVIGCTVLVMSALAVFDRSVLHSQFDAAERLEVRRDVMRVLNAVDVQGDSLDVLVRDWASWNDTYEFMETRSADYLERNIIPDLVEALDISAFVLVDLRGETVFAQTLTMDGQYAPVAGLTDDAPGRRELLRRATARQQVVGIHRLPDGPMLVAARAVLRTDDSGQPRGMLLMGRWIDAEFADRLARDLATPLSVAPLGPADPPPDGAVIATLLSSEWPASVRVEDGHQIGYGLVRDLEDTPAFIVRTVQSRETAALSRRAFTLSMVAVAGTGFLLAAAILAGIERWLVTPMVRLRREMEAIGSGDVTRVTVDGQDEVTRVALSVNEMLDRLSLAAQEQERLTGIATDQRNLAETALAEMSDGLLAFSTEGMCTVCNPAAAQLLGLPSARVVGRPISELLPGLDATLTAQPAGPRLIEMDGRTVAVTRSQGAGRRHGRASVAVLRDVTDILDVERLKRDIIATVSHELRTPLTAIRATVDLFESGDAGQLTDVQQRMVLLLGRNVDRLRHIVNDLLDLTSLESGRVRLDMGEVDMALACERVAEDLRPAATAADVTLEVEATEDAIAWADAARIRQVLENLVQNAVKFSHPRGYVRITARREAGEVTVRIADGGIGIAPEEQTRVFEKFYRTRAAARAAQGTGLGLPIARLIVEMHGGRIRMESDGHSGTTAVFTVPVAPPATAIAEP